MVARKRYRDGVPSTSLDLGIRKNDSPSNAKRMKNKTSSRTNEENTLTEDTNFQHLGKNDQDIHVDDENAITCGNKICSTIPPNDRNPSESSIKVDHASNISDTTSMSQSELKKDPGPSSLSLLSCDYGSSNGSSDTD